MIEHKVDGGDDVRLHVAETGNPAGQPILFIHGWSASHIVWARQLDSGLAARHRLVALDLRGHGDSGKPADAYAYPRLWAADVAAVIEQLRLDHPLLCGWSYGGLVINDYLRCCGAERIAGVHYIGAATDLGIETTYPFLGPAWDGLLPGADGSTAGTVFADGLEDGSQAMRTFVQRCFGGTLSPEDEMLVLGANVLCPPRVRAALFARQVANDDVLGAVSLPALVSHGEADDVVDIATGQHIAAAIPGAVLSSYEGAGHAMFWTESERFNHELATFAATCRAPARL